MFDYASKQSLVSLTFNSNHLWKVERERAIIFILRTSMLSQLKKTNEQTKRPQKVLILI